MHSKFISGAAFVALLGAAAMAQPQDPNPKPAGDKPMPKAESTASAQMPMAAFCYKASDVVGADVRNATGVIGEVEDLVVDPMTGRIDYAVVSLKERGADQWHAVPWSTLSVPAAMPTDKKDVAKPEFALNVDASRVKNAPGFPKDKWPDINGPAWRSEVDSHYDARGAARGDTISEFHGLRASELLKTELYTKSKEKLGGISDLAVDPKNGRITYAVVSTGGFLGMGDKLHAIPWEAIRPAADVDGKVKKGDNLTVDLNKDRLMKAPEFKDSEWARMSDRAWVSELYTYYGVKPYWAGSTTPSDRETKSANPPAPKPEPKEKKPQ